MKPPLKLHSYINKTFRVISSHSPVYENKQRKPIHPCEGRIGKAIGIKGSGQFRILDIVNYMEYLCWPDEMEEVELVWQKK